jgi:hypothetical protein
LAQSSPGGVDLTGECLIDSKALATITERLTNPTARLWLA